MLQPENDFGADNCCCPVSSPPSPPAYFKTLLSSTNVNFLDSFHKSVTALSLSEPYVDVIEINSQNKEKESTVTDDSISIENNATSVRKKLKFSLKISLSRGPLIIYRLITKRLSDANCPRELNG